MHYVAIVAVVLLVCFAYGGHSGTFVRAFDAATAGDTGTAASLFGDAVSNTLRDADTAGRRAVADEPAGRNEAAVPNERITLR